MDQKPATFFIRATQPQDANKLYDLDSHVRKFSAMAKFEPDVQDFEQSKAFAQANISQTPFLVALRPSGASGHQPPSLIDLDDHSTETFGEAKYSHSPYVGQVLGYLGMTPYKDLQTCKHTGSMLWQITSLASIGTLTYRAILKELVDRFVVTILERTTRTTPMAEFPFSMDNLEHVTWQGVLLESGFRIIGQAQEVYFKNGIFYHRLSLQLVLRKQQS